MWVGIYIFLNLVNVVCECPGPKENTLAKVHFLGNNASIMQGVAANLSDKEIKAVSNYISGLN